MHSLLQFQVRYTHLVVCWSMLDFVNLLMLRTSMTTANQNTLILLKLRTTKKPMSFDLIYTSYWRKMSALLNIWILSRKKNHKKRSVSENADCHCYKWGSYLYTTVGVPCFRSKEMGKRPFQGLHHSHILSFLNANNISNEYTTMYQFPQRPHGENQTH